MNDNKIRHVFISYVKENIKEVNRLCIDLEKYGVRVWLDRKEIMPGMRWKEAIREAIAQGSFFLACFSKEYSSRDKSYMNEELTFAIEQLRQYPTNRRWFIPVLLSECAVPARSIGGGETLLDIQWVQLYEEWNEGITRILNVIRPVPLNAQKLIDSLRNDMFSFQRSKAANELGVQGNVVAVPALIESLSDDDPDVRSACSSSLGKIGDISAVPELLKIIDDKDSKVRQNVIRSLSVLGDPNAIQLLLYKAKEDKNENVRVSAFKALEALGASKSFIKDALKDHDVNIKLWAINALVRVEKEFGLSNLIEALKDRHFYVCREAVKAIAKIGDAACIDVLMTALKHDDVEVRLFAAQALRNISDVSLLYKFKERLFDEDPEIKMISISVLEKFNKGDLISLLDKVIKDNDARVRWRTVVALSHIGSDNTIPLLREALHDGYKGVRDEARKSLTIIAKSRVKRIKSKKFV